MWRFGYRGIFLKTPSPQVHETYCTFSYVRSWQSGHSWFEVRPGNVLGSLKHLEEIGLLLRLTIQNRIDVLLLDDRSTAGALGFGFQLGTKVVHVKFAGLCLARLLNTVPVTASVEIKDGRGLRTKLCHRLSSVPSPPEQSPRVLRLSAPPLAASDLSLALRELDPLAC